MKFFSAIAAIILFFAFGALAEMTNGLSDAEIQGRNLAQQISAQWPATNTAQTGILSIRGSNGTSTNIPIKFGISVLPKHWDSYYSASLNDGSTELLVVTHVKNKPNHYSHLNPAHDVLLPIYGDAPFANSDFWVTDLGLEFLHWPEQKVLPNPTNLKRGRSYTLLESTNPNPSTNGYSRVLSYIDKETGGILEAEAYDSHGRLLKEFYPKDFKKVDGQWQVQSMEMDNVQTGSRSWIEFDVKKQ